MSIKIGNLDVSSFKVGSADCRVYLGDTCVYSGDTPTPPAFEGKYQLTLSDSTTVSAECDGTSAITNSEISAYALLIVAAEIGDCVRSIGDDTFTECTNLASIDIPNSVTSMGIGVFNSCTSLASCTIGSGVTSIDDDTFAYCISLTSCTIGSGVTSIGSGAFAECTSLASIDIPNSVTTIGSNAFTECTSLASIDIPSGVTRINFKAFNGCSSLTSITVNATTPPTLGNYAFDNTNNCPIYVPAESVETYKAASGWSAYVSRIQAIV